MQAGNYKGHRDTLDIPGPHSKEQLMENVYQMSARNIPDLSRSNHVTGGGGGGGGVGLFT